ncbi:MAG: protein kinase [Thermoanaerobaculia bacterium]|nr:protein kinase [Thermoanaerobaculia bacterium]
MSEERIGKYEVLGKIAEGGFGTVYKARDPYIKRIVAIKTCPIDDEEIRERFFREARIVGRFDHPHVTIVHDFGVEGDRAFLVQEYLPGHDLAEIIRRGKPIALRRKVSYLLQAARGLAYAHAQGVIHRDIKPANLRVLKSDQVKVLDFGIAKVATSGTRLTQKGVAMGTIGYLSPEQLQEKPLDVRTDIFSFGVTAYELLAYRKPFRGKNISSVMRAILDSDPEPIPEIVPGIPDDLTRVIRRCLEKDRSDRYSSFDAVITDLERIQRRLPSQEEAGTSPVTTPSPDDEEGAAPTDAASETSEKALEEEAEEEEKETEDGEGVREVLPSVDSIDAEVPGRGTHPVEVPESPSEDTPAAPDAAPAPQTSGEPAETEERDEEAKDRSEPVPPRDSSAQEEPSPEPGPSRSRLALIVTAVVVLLAAAGGGLWWLLDGEKGTETERETEPETSSPMEEPVQETSTVPATGSLVVDARPWAEIVSILDESGEEVDMATDRSTPFRLHLEPGVYSVVLSHPVLEEPEVCQVQVVAGETTLCEVPIDELEVNDYFRETGWWQ